VDTSEFLVAFAASIGFLVGLGSQGIKPAIVLPLLVGAWLATRAVYFIGTDPERANAVTIYRGLPFELPLGIDLYSRWRGSGVTLESVPAGRRETFTNHKLRSKDDAENLIIQLERGQLDS
jgi:protein phosphatase